MDVREIQRRTLTGIGWKQMGAAVTLSLGILRAILLARFLMPQEVGLAALARFFVEFSGRLMGLDLDRALVQHPRPQEGTYRTYVSLRLGVGVVRFGILWVLAPALGRLYPGFPGLSLILRGFAVSALLAPWNGFQEAMLRRRLAFRRLALADVASAVVATVGAPWLAWAGWGAWALVAERLLGLGARFLVLWSRPAWHPRPGWRREEALHFLRFGFPLWVNGWLTYLLDRAGDFWSGTFLGGAALGFYNKAYELALYGRRAVAKPISEVLFSTFARLQEDRPALSQAFFRSFFVLVRFGAFLALGLALLAPEGIPFLLGPQWRPMVRTFQLMVVYTWLDPLSMVASYLLIAVGQPRLTARVRGIQILVFLPAMALLGRLWGIEGVALAADLMAVVGIGWLLAYGRRYVSYSWRAVWIPPLAAGLGAGGAAWWAGWTAQGLGWPSGAVLAVRLGALLLLFPALLFLLEGPRLRRVGGEAWGLLRGRWARRGAT